MAKPFDPDRLLAACGDLSEDAGITIHTVLEPLAGPGAPVKPAVYEGGRYQLDRRWDYEVDPPEPVDVVVIDNVPSQANRLEAALERLRDRLGLPEIVLDLSGLAALPPHLPKSLSSFRFPHRQADAYLRDALLDGKRFPDTDLGRALLAANADEPNALLQWFPQALLFGFWQSHLGKKRSQAKLARSWVSEIVGYRPATVETRVLAVKGDPLALSVDEPALFDENDLLAGWSLVEGAKKASASKEKDKKDKKKERPRSAMARRSPRPRPLRFRLQRSSSDPRFRLRHCAECGQVQKTQMRPLVPSLWPSASRRMWPHSDAPSACDPGASSGPSRRPGRGWGRPTRR